nr:putative ribonuclease H-like domain-containing protein [Tanacetum cinerariifolium]
MVVSVDHLFARPRSETLNSPIQKSFRRQPRRSFKSSKDFKLHAITKRVTPISGNHSSIAVGKYSGSGNDLSILFPTEFKGGSVAFGDSNGIITDKGKIKDGRLDFEDVYYMEELKHYNIFSVSQICDKKNKVLFTDTDCLVLSLNFKLPDENQEELEKLKRQEKEANDAVKKEATHETQEVNTNNTNLLNAVSTPVSVVGPLRALNNDEPSYPDDPSMPYLEEIYASLMEPKKSVKHWKMKVRLMLCKKNCCSSKFRRNKKDESGVVVRIKARLVAQGHRQDEGIYYDEVFALVARIEAIRIFLAFASYMGIIIYQMDLKSAFLYGTIDKEVYVTQPPGFVDHKFPNKREADTEEELLTRLYSSSKTKRISCLFRFMWMISFLAQQRSLDKEDGIFISQDNYMVEILKKFDFLRVKTANTPIETQKPLVKDEEVADVDVHLHRSMIGSLMYLTASRPNIMFAVCACSRF